ncbi:helix-turn-helix domain-containing protein [Gordonia sp. HY285]|uniref:helix-turn-helix domain-containing protein n=1 Tax=Gordonia liuliyuniae TaxID=2911517 RepID=UPI001F287BCB|nr:helix-turn-helix transcriptional regulator [Gordonia liuliyuniae]MCF8609997.1 helix-turn-helix domain-containing protein [Gordonia liuliyuniae]
METEVIHVNASPSVAGDEMKHIGAVITSLREAYGWRLGKFAEAIETTHSHLSNIEAGRKRCTPEMARRIADTLGVPLAAITTGRPVEEIA